MQPGVLPLGTGLLLQAGAVIQAQKTPFTLGEIFTFLFLMLGPVKIIGPFAEITSVADSALARRLALSATLYSSLALLLAAFLGERLLAKYDIPLPVLALAAGIVLFLVALRTILQQFNAPDRSAEEVTAPTLSMAIMPLAFPTIVTPYGIAALMIFIALSPDLEGKLMIGVILLAIMLLNLIAMLLARRILGTVGVFLQILGAVLGIIQVALGLQIIIFYLKTLWV
jgi:multiple antibiotic resistance protein